MSKNAAIAKISSELIESMNVPVPDPPSLRLYEIITALEEIDNDLTENGGELTPEIEERLESLGGSLDGKVDSICRLRQNRLASADACKAERERLQKREDAYRRGAESLRCFLMGAFVRLGKDKIKTPSFTVYLQNNPIAIRWTRDVSDLPEQYKRVTIAPNIEAMKDAYKHGEGLPEGAVVVQGQHLRIG